MTEILQTGLLFSLIFTNPAMAQEIKPVVPVVREFNSTTSIAAYIREKARERGVDEELALKIAQCESNLIPQQSKYIMANGEREPSYGIWQIYLPGKNISIEKAMDIEWSTEWSIQRLKEGKANLWTCAKYVDK